MATSPPAGLAEKALLASSRRRSEFKANYLRPVATGGLCGPTAGAILRSHPGRAIRASFSNVTPTGMLAAGRLAALDTKVEVVIARFDFDFDS